VAVATDGGLGALTPGRPLPVDPKRLMSILGSTLTDETRAVVAAAPPGQRATLVLGSPDFMRR
jgi:hypothetical protein